MNLKTLAATHLLLRPKQNMRMWVHPINQGHEDLVEYCNVAKELQDFPEKIYTYFHTDFVQFDDLLKLIRSKIAQQITNLQVFLILNFILVRFYTFITVIL